MIELSATLGLAGLVRPVVASPTVAVDMGAFGALMSTSFAADESSADLPLAQATSDYAEREQHDGVDLVELGVLTGMISVAIPPPTVPVITNAGTAAPLVPTRHPAKPSLEMEVSPEALPAPAQGNPFEFASPIPLARASEAQAMTPAPDNGALQTVKVNMVVVAPPAILPAVNPGALSPAAVGNMTVSPPMPLAPMTRAKRPDAMPPLATIAVEGRMPQTQVRSPSPTSAREQSAPVVDTVDTFNDPFLGASTTAVIATSPSDIATLLPATTVLQSAAAVVERHLDLARGDLWLAELAKDIVSLADRDDQLSFRLNPRHLGQLDVSLTQSDAGVSIEMTAAQDEARAILTAAQPRLIDDIRAQGVRVADAHVGSGSSGGLSSGQGGGQNAPRAPHPVSEITSVASETSSSPTQARPDGRFA